MNRSAVIAALGVLLMSASAQADSFKDKVKAETSTVGLHPGVDPGMYICGNNHLHIKGTVHNQAGVALGRVKVGGKAYSADGQLLGSATATTKKPILAANEKAEIDLEFLTVSGAMIDKVKKHELVVLEAMPLKKGAK
jgi:hypothetical protein